MGEHKQGYPCSAAGTEQHLNHVVQIPSAHMVIWAVVVK